MSSTYAYLIGEIGVIHSRLQLYYFDNRKKNETIIGEDSFHSQSYTTLEQIVDKFLKTNVKTSEHHPKIAVFSLSGIVHDEKATIDKLSWDSDAKNIENETGIEKVYFLNDYTASGHGLPYISDQDLYALRPETIIPRENATKLIIGTGNTLGEAILFQTGDHFIVSSGDGGHSDFASRNKEEFDLLTSIKKDLNISRVTVERIVSESGILYIYQHFIKTKATIVNEKITDLVLNAHEPVQIIMNHATSQNYDPICKLTLQTFMNIYGAEIGNMGCRILPFGGIYITGRLAPLLYEQMKKSDFVNNFLEKGRLRQYLAQIPVYVVLNRDITLIGARVYARNMILEDSDIRINKKCFENEMKVILHKELFEEIKKKRAENRLVKPKKEYYESILKEIDQEIDAKKAFLWASIGFMTSAAVFSLFLLAKKSINRRF